MKPDPVRTLRTMALFPECVDPEVRAFWEALARSETAQSSSTLSSSAKGTCTPVAAEVQGDSIETMTTVGQIP